MTGDHNLRHWSVTLTRTVEQIAVVRVCADDPADALRRLKDEREPEWVDDDITHPVETLSIVETAS